MKQNITRRKDYSDIDLDFIPHPTTKDVVKKTGIDAIKRSVRNLVLTNFYDRPFRSFIGSNAQGLLFENINQLTAIFLKDAIEEVIVNFEPRIRLINDENRGIRVSVDSDNNGYSVQLSFVVINTAQPVTINLFLERIR